MPRKPVDPVIRYLAKVNKKGPDECWPWTAACYGNGYGQFGVSKEERSVLAHRFGYKSLVGPIPDGDKVLHTCDNPPCQNPNHWYLGSQKDNADDRETRGRGNHPKGERNNSRLTEGQVREILALFERGGHTQDIADRFGIRRRLVYAIARGERWGHLDRPPVTRTRKGNPKLTDDDVRAIRQLRADGLTLQEIGARFGVTFSNVGHIVSGRSRADVVQDLPTSTS